MPLKTLVARVRPVGRADSNAIGRPDRVPPARRVNSNAIGRETRIIHRVVPKKTNRRGRSTKTGHSTIRLGPKERERKKEREREREREKKYASLELVLA